MDKQAFILIPLGNMEHVVPAILHCGYQVIIIYYPGIGESPGKSLSSRSETILEKGGAGDILMDVLK